MRYLGENTEKIKIGDGIIIENLKLAILKKKYFNSFNSVIDVGP